MKIRESDLTDEQLSAARHVVQWGLGLLESPSHPVGGMVVLQAILKDHWKGAAGLDDGLDDGLYDGLYDGLDAGLYAGLRAGLHDGLRDGLRDGLHAGDVSLC